MMKTKHSLMNTLFSLPLMGVFTLVAMPDAYLSAADNQQDSSEIQENNYTAQTKPQTKKLIKDADGSLVEIDPDGTQIVNKADGTLIQIKPNGSKIIRNTDGSSIEIDPDGSKTIKKSDGSFIQIKAPNGHSEEN